MAGEREQNLTDPQYWDDVWSGADAHPAFVDLDCDAYQFGPDGIFTRTVRRTLGSLRGKSVLEIGGGGPNLRLLALCKHCQAEVSAVDFSARGLEQLAKLFAFHGCQLAETHAGDFMTCDLGPRRYDYVVHWGVAEHITNLAVFFRRCHDVLAPGGRMFFAMPNMFALAAWGWRRWSPRSWAKHICHATAELQQACAAAGFQHYRELYFGPPFLGWHTYEQSGLGPSLSRFAQRVADRLARHATGGWANPTNSLLARNRAVLVDA